MIEKIDLDEYGRKIFKAKGSPKNLDDINIELSGWYAYFSEQIIFLEISEAEFYQEKKNGEAEKPLSDKNIEYQWKVTENGKEHIRVKQTIKTLEKLMSNIKSSIRRAETEART